MSTVSARQLVLWIQASIRSLALNPEFGSLDAVYRELAAASGMSKSSIMKLVSGESANPTAATIDKLIAAIKDALRKAAA